MRELVVHSPSEAYSFELGRRIGELLEAGDVVALWGELGAGKTSLTQGIARGIGIPEQTPITSPTFTFINEYDGRHHFYHLDLYRLSDSDELETLPWREALYGSDVAAVEWPERLGDDLPDERWDVRIEITGDETRTITLTPQGDRNMARLERWGRELAR